jgi:hypothetical protein
MKKDPENKIKGCIGESIAEELFKELGFFIMRLGKEYTVNPLTQLQEFINKCGGKFELERATDEIREITQINVLPDFVIVSPKGKVSLLEVKFRWNGKLYPQDSLVFKTYPEAHMMIINLTTDGEDISLPDKEDKEIFDKELKNSRFHIWFREDCTEKDDSLSVFSLNDWLKVDFEIVNKEIIEKYEKLTEKYLKTWKEKTNSEEIVK